jgi:hypothetical protein
MRLLGLAAAGLVVMGGPGEPCTFYSCTQLPIECQNTTDCACFQANAPCQCTYDGNGFEVMCPGG